MGPASLFYTREKNEPEEGDRVICSGLNVSTVESGLESYPFIAASLYSRDFTKEETANDVWTMSSLERKRIGYSPKGPHRIGTTSLSRFTMLKSLRLAVLKHSSSILEYKFFCVSGSYYQGSWDWCKNQNANLLIYRGEKLPWETDSQVLASTFSFP